VKHIDAIFKHAESEYPRESCGLLAKLGGEELWFPCENHAEDTEEGFLFNSVEYMTITMKTDSIVAIVHSHPDQEEAQPSKHDIQVCNFIKIPYLIVSYPSMDFYWLNPGDLDG